MNNQVSFDSLLRMAIRETYMEQINSIPSEEKLEQILHPSHAFKQKISAIVRRETRNEKLIQMRRITGRVAVVIMLCISLTFGSLLTAKAVRESVATTILEWHDKFTRIFIETDVPPTQLPEIRFNYIPEGFELVEEESFIIPDTMLLTYRNDKINFLQIIISSSNDTNIDKSDNEFSSFYSIKIDERYGTWISKDNENQLIIFNLYTYNIVGELKIEEIIKIYKNIEIL